MAKEPLVTRNFRVVKQEWDTAMGNADVSGLSVSDYLRDCVDWRNADPALWVAVEAKAAERGETMRAVVLRQLRAYLDA